MAKKYLGPEDVGAGVGLDEVISPPFDGLQRVLQLAGRGDLLAVLDHAPRQHRDGESHREAKLHMIARVVVASHEIDLQQN